ncbi:hypothetical protein CASFOL_017618 [Castilleja foliolosa]|uniref:Uncharacterized protein n=1 Tax=Castilleja foliolosa TaxID=1961234 RepID=A0ABD3D8C4_9LAMI
MVEDEDDDVVDRKHPDDDIKFGSDEDTADSDDSLGHDEL